MKNVLFATAVALSLFPLTGGQSALAHETKAGDLTIIHANSRPNLPNRPMAGYMGISNDGTTPDRLIGAASPAFETIELHMVEEDNGVMKMLQIPGIEVPGEDTVLLDHGGFHLMMFGAKDLYREGDEVPLTLQFERAGAVDVTLKIEKSGSKDDHSDHSGHSGH